MKTIEEIIAMFGGVDGLYVSIANEPFMRLVIEHIGEGPLGLPAISVAHYYEMNVSVRLTASIPEASSGDEVGSWSRSRQENSIGGIEAVRKRIGWRLSTKRAG
jgi:hypothetical protein